MRLHEITDYLENIAPLRFQESYDNAGLIVGNNLTEVTGAIISLDCTEDVVNEAIEKGCNLIISHHPIIFKGIKQFTGEHYVDKTIIAAIKNDVAIYAIHTNLDNVLRNGVNEKIGTKLGLSQMEVLRPKEEDNLETAYTVGSGVIGDLVKAKDAFSFLTYVKEQMNCGVVKHTKLLDQPISKVAICGGSGSFLLKTAIARGAELFITADFKYHEFFDANDKIIIADIGHYESEFYTIELLFELITEKFPKFAPHCTNLTTNPVNYI